MSNLITKYFEAFNNKDLDALSEMYADDVVLNEWNENVFEGKEAVLKANKELFEKFDKLNIKVCVTADRTNSFMPVSYTSLNEISVSLDDNTHITVIDVIEVERRKIIGIRAYRGF